MENFDLFYLFITFAVISLNALNIKGKGKVFIKGRNWNQDQEGMNSISQFSRNSPLYRTRARKDQE